MPFWPGSLRPLKIIGGVVLLRSDGAALLQLRDNKPGLNAAGQWVFPGGHCEPPESLENGARREFLEETGYRCGALCLVTSFCHPSDDLQGMYELSLFFCPYDGVQEVNCYEGQEVRFVQRAEADGYAIPSYLLPVWDLALNDLGSSRIESHQNFTGGSGAS